MGPIWQLADVPGNGLNDQQNNLTRIQPDDRRRRQPRRRARWRAWPWKWRRGRQSWLNTSTNQAAQQVTDNFKRTSCRRWIGTLPRPAGSAQMPTQARNTAEQQTGKALGDLATNIYGGAYRSDMANKRMPPWPTTPPLGSRVSRTSSPVPGSISRASAIRPRALASRRPLQGLRYDDATRQLQTGTSMQQAPWLPLQHGSSIINGAGGADLMQMQSTNTPIGSQLVGMGTGIAGLGTNTIGGLGSCPFSPTAA